MSLQRFSQPESKTIDQSLRQRQAINNNFEYPKGDSSPYGDALRKLRNQYVPDPLRRTRNGRLAM